MAYVQFNPDRPDVAAGGATRLSEITYARTNDDALQDMLAAFAGMRGFNLSITTSTSDGPTTILATNGAQIVKKAITYGSGVTAGLPTVIVFSKSIDTGGSYDTIGTCTIGYDGSGNFLTTTWS